MGILLTNSKHTYDVDPVKTYCDIERYLQKNNFPSGTEITKEFYLAVIRHTVVQCCKLCGISFDDAINNTKGYITLRYGFNDFHHYLARMLVFSDPLKVKSILTYQKKKSAVKAQGKFETFIEHAVYNAIRVLPFDTTLVREDVMQWVAQNQRQAVTVVAKIPATRKGISRIESALSDGELKKVSKRVYRKNYTQQPLDFFKAIRSGEKKQWKGTPGILALLLFQMKYRGFISTAGNRGYFMAAHNLFVDYRNKSNKKTLRLSELSSRICKSLEAGNFRYRKEQMIVDHILDSISV